MNRKNANVLIVDDDPAIRRLLNRWLSDAGYAVAQAVSGEGAVASIEADCPDFVVTDWEMPGGMSGLDLCRYIRRADLAHYIYTVMLTARSDADDYVSALQSGVDDFARKPVDRLELLARLDAGARIVEMERRLSLVAGSDSLTGVASKRTFDDCLRREWRRTRRYRTQFSCVMLDIDYFKRINDAYGHPAGDEVIRTIARVLQESSRDADIVARVGGEEFCVLLTETGEEQATVWAERLRAQIAAAPIVVDGTTLSVTASLGVAQVTEDVENAAQIVMRADQCLLAAKQSGRDRVVGFEELQRIRAACRDPENAAGLLFAGVVARDVMSTIVASLPMDATIGWAARYFVRFRFASAPVVDANRKLAGFLSEKDVMNVLLWPDWWNRKVSDVMKTNVVCYEEGAPMLPIYEFLCRMPIRSVVVTRQGRPTGMISRGALLRWVGNAALAHRNRHVPGGGATSGAERRQLALTAAAISKQIRELQTALDGDLTDNVTPQIVGGASRIQELVNDLLACGQQFGAAAARQRDNDAFVSDDAGGLQLADCSPTAADTNGISSAT